MPSATMYSTVRCDSVLLLPPLFSSHPAAVNVQGNSSHLFEDCSGAEYVHGQLLSSCRHWVSHLGDRSWAHSFWECGDDAPLRGTLTRGAVSRLSVARLRFFTRQAAPSLSSSRVERHLKLLKVRLLPRRVVLRARRRCSGVGSPRIHRSFHVCRSYSGNARRTRLTVDCLLLARVLCTKRCAKGRASSLSQLSFAFGMRRLRLLQR